MELFTNALLIATGVIVAVGVAYTGYHTLRFAAYFMIGLVKLNVAKRNAAATYEANARRNAARQARLKTLATEAMESAEVQIVVAGLLATPYIDGRTATAKANNKQRAKLLGELRNLVDCSATREFLYRGQLAA